MLRICLHLPWIIELDLKKKELFSVCLLCSVVGGMLCIFRCQDMSVVSDIYKNLVLKNHSATLLDLPVKPLNTKEADMRESPNFDNKNMSA